MKSLKKRLYEMGATNIKRVELVAGAFYRFELNGEKKLVKIQSNKACDNIEEMEEKEIKWVK